MHTPPRSSRVAKHLRFAVAILVFVITALGRPMVTIVLALLGFESDPQALLVARSCALACTLSGSRMCWAFSTSTVTRALVQYNPLSTFGKEPLAREWVH
jgi:hypothetical protein